MIPRPRLTLALLLTVFIAGCATKSDDADPQPWDAEEGEAIERLQAWMRSDEFRVWWRAPGAPDVAARFQWADDGVTRPRPLGVWSYPAGHEELLRRVRAALAG